MGKRYRVGLTLLFGAALLLGASNQVEAQSGGEVRSVRVGHDFGEEIRFSAEVASENPVREVFLVFRDIREEHTRVLGMHEENGRFVYNYDASQNLLRPFATLSLWFQVTLENGEGFTSQKYTYTYSDNRFVWQTREDGNLRVHWSDGGESFGQAALDSTRSGFDGIQNLFPADSSQPIDVYIYASPTDLQNALLLGGQSWLAGHASPELGIVFVSIAPGAQEKILMQKQIPHELAHVLLYRRIGEGYNRLPTWLLEGIASLAELYPNPDYQLALERAVSQDNLIPISALCLPFSRDASQAFLSYAEAVSFTRYLHATYGASGLDRLIGVYADGVDCETGAMRVFGQSLAYLDATWRESVLGANLLGVALRATAPYLLILAIILAHPAAQFFAANAQRKKDER